MIKNTATIAFLVICFSLLITTGCGSKQSISNANTEVSNRSVVQSGVAMENNSATSPLSTPTTNASVSAGSPQTVQVRLTEVETNADLIDAPIAKAKIIVKAGMASLDKLTDDDGVVLFDAVACGDQEVMIIAHDEESDEDTIFRRKLRCDRPLVDLGVLTKPFGGKFILEERQPQHIEYDPGKNVWMSEGKVVPNEKIRKILSRYGS
jgi:hypothetical protein